MPIRLIIITLLLNATLVSGQARLIKQIDQRIKFIDSQQKLTVRHFDASKVYKQITDGGGDISVFLLDNKIVKIKQEINLSAGRITTIIYLNCDTPIAIIEKEEIFEWPKNASKFNYKKLRRVFWEKIYVSDGDSFKTITQGKRFQSEQACGTSESLTLIETTQKLMGR